jgi:hypothetical protein
VLVETEPVDATIDLGLGVAAAAGGFADGDLLSIRRLPLERARAPPWWWVGETHAAPRVGLGRVGHTTAKVTP